MALALWLTGLAAQGQGTYRVGGLPSLNLNARLKSDWSLNLRAESRQLFLRGVLDGETEADYRYVLTDFSLIAAKKVGLNSRLAGGYLLRVENGELTQRFIQQYTAVQKLARFRLAHRFVFDQTLSPGEQPEFRLRYRIASEIPLDGASADPGEFYLKISNEYLHRLQSAEYDLEVRLIPLLGFDLSDRLKIESGLDYRLASFLSGKARHSYWMALNFFIEIDCRN